jgi:ABC-type phosphate transport system permease subunit
MRQICITFVSVARAYARCIASIKSSLTVGLLTLSRIATPILYAVCEMACSDPSAACAAASLATGTR